jgi:nucleoside-diphosphate-sugar epimerase
MKLFVTGATGYIGAAVTERLCSAGRQVFGLARSEESARKLERLGATPVRGDLRDAATMQEAARNSDGAIHMAMEHSAEGPHLDAAVVEGMLAALGGTGRPFLYTSGIWVMGDTGGRVVDEDSAVNPATAVSWRPAREERVRRAPGVRGIVIRPGIVYGRSGGIIGDFERAAREDGVVRHVGTGSNRWPCVHLEDLADLYLLALDNAAAGSLYFGAAEAAVSVAEIARAAARGVPVEAIPLEEARQTMGAYADALAMDQRISAAKAMRELGWSPRRKSVLEELAG